MKLSLQSRSAFLNRRATHNPSHADTSPIGAASKRTGEPPHWDFDSLRAILPYFLSKTYPSIDSLALFQLRLPLTYSPTFRDLWPPAYGHLVGAHSVGTTPSLAATVRQAHVTVGRDIPELNYAVLCMCLGARRKRNSYVHLRISA